MLQLHDRTRRRICLAAFVLLCLAPTALVAAWCVAWQLPSHLTAEVERLRLETGLEIAIDAMISRGQERSCIAASPWPIQRRDRPSCVARCWKSFGRAPPTRRGWISRRSCSRRRGRRSRLASAHRLVQLLERILQNPGGWADTEIRLSAKEVAMRTGDDSPAMVCQQAVVAAPRGGAQARIVFRVAGSAASGPVKVRLVRDRTAAPPASRWEFDTGGAALPYSLMGVALPQLARLGPESRFCGRLVARQTPEGWLIQGDGQMTPQAPRVARRESPSDPPPAPPQAHLRLGKGLEQ